MHRDSPRAKLRCKLTIKFKPWSASVGLEIRQADLRIRRDGALQVSWAARTGSPTRRRPFPRPICFPTESVVGQRTFGGPIRPDPIPQFDPRAAYETTPRLEAPVGSVGVEDFPRFEDFPKFEDLPKETASRRRAALRKLGLLSVKSHFFSSTYCFPRRASNPD